MSWFAGSITGTNENPVVTASRGEFFVPEDSGKGGKILKRLLIGLGLIALFIGICLLSSHIDYVKSMPPEFEKLSIYIGETMPELSWRTKGVKYADVPFHLELLEKDGELFAMEYTTSTAADAESVCSVAQRLKGRYGDADDFTRMALSVLEEKDLADLKDGESLTWSWELGYVFPYDSEKELLDCLFLDLQVTALSTEGNYQIVLYAEARPEGSRLFGDNQ